jgi:hypothetical protein
MNVSHSNSFFLSLLFFLAASGLAMMVVAPLDLPCGMAGTQ